MMNLFSFAFLGILAFGCASTDINSVSVEQQNDCLTIENFNFVASYIEGNGEQIKISERLMSDIESSALETSIGERFVLLEDYQNHKNIIVIDKNEDNKTPPYFVSNKNNEVQISAYYSRFDIDKDIKTRAADWCDIVSELTRN